MDSLLPLEGGASRPKLKAAPNDAKPREDGGAEAFEAVLADTPDDTKKVETTALTKDAESLTDSPAASSSRDLADTNAVLVLDAGNPIDRETPTDTEPVQRAPSLIGSAQTDTATEIGVHAASATESAPGKTDIAKGTFEAKPQSNPADIVARADAVEAANAERQSLADVDAAAIIRPAGDPQKVALPEQDQSQARIEPAIRANSQVATADPTDAAISAPNASAIEAIEQAQNIESATKTDPTSERAQRADFEASPDARSKTEPALTATPKDSVTPTSVLADAPQAQAEGDIRPQSVAADPAADAPTTVKSDVEGKATTDAQLAADAQLNKQTANLTANAVAGEGGKSVELATAAVTTASSTIATSLQSTIATPPGMQAQQAVLVASPSDIPDIVSRVQAGGSEDGDQRVLVRLDPPELGKVSIDFKFDSQGLQHVTITAETPEAIKRLREMHFELVQGLEQSGLTGQDMTFRQETPNQADPGQWAGTTSEATDQMTGEKDIRLTMETLSGTTGHRDASGRLNIRL